MNKTLFIGGVWDGQWHDVREGTPIVSAPHPIKAARIYDFVSVPGNIDIDDYRRFQIHISGRDFTLYALVGLHADDIIMRLLNHYRPEKLSV